MQEVEFRIGKNNPQCYILLIEPCGLELTVDERNEYVLEGNQYCEITIYWKPGRVEIWCDVGDYVIRQGSNIVYKNNDDSR